MTVSKIISAIIVILGAVYTAVNVYVGGEPSPAIALMAVIGLVLGKLFSAGRLRRGFGLGLRAGC